MIQDQFSQSVSSFVSFALAQQPTVVLGDGIGPNGVSIAFGKGKRLSEAEFVSIDKLVRKFEEVRNLLPSTSSLDALQVHNERPQITFQPNTKYTIVSIDAEQLAIAKDVSRLAEKVYEAHAAGQHEAARGHYDDLQSLLKLKREAFLGDFVNVPEIDGVVGSHAVGRTGNPTEIAGGAVIFVIIEVYIN
jgi:hypothetical protein